MKMSDNGRKLLQQWEGIRKDVYNDSAGLPTIGCGHLLTRDELSSGKIIINGTPVKYCYGLTLSQIDQLLSHDLVSAEYAVNSGVDQELNQNQFDALCSFTFNVGVKAFMNSTLLKCINGGDYSEVPFQLRRWNKSGGKVVAGLINRRENEIRLWESL